MIDKPKLLHWAITNNCNLSCGFCFGHKEKDVSFKMQQLIFSRFVESGVEQISFTGGEPLLAKNLAYFAKQCDEYGIKSSLHTNATIESKFYEVCDLFDRISFSLDGASAEINSEMRGFPVYQETVHKAIDYLLEKEKDFVVKTIVTKRNYQSVLQMVPYIKRIKPKFWSLFEFRPIRRGKVNNDKYSLPHADFDNVTNQIREDISNDVVLNIRSNEDAKKNPLFLVSGEGLVYTNDENFDDILVGNLNENTVLEIWQKIMELKGENLSYEQRNLNLNKRMI